MSNASREKAEHQINRIEEKLEYRFLFEELVRRDFIKKYKRTALGIVWSVLTPLLHVLVLTLVFTQFFGRNTPHYMIYVFCGNLLFMYFSDATNSGMSSIVGNARIFTKTTVPKYLFLLASNVQSLINFLLVLVVFFLFAAFDHVTFTGRYLLLVYPIFCMVLFNIGIGMFLATLFVFFRDTQYLYKVIVQLLRYLSAIFYRVESLPQYIQNLLLFNPVYLFILYFRLVVLDGTIPPMWLHLRILIYTAVALALGAHMYLKYNRSFLYYI